MLNILTFNGVYIPGYKAGGPIRSLDNMVAYLDDEITFYIVTRDRDQGDTEPYSNVKINKWNSRDKEYVYYQAEEDFSTFTLKNIINSKKFDGVLLNGTFSEYTYRYLILRKLNLIENIPVIIMPRGDLNSGALNLKKIKKLTYLNLMKIMGLHKDLNWLATSESEKNDIINFQKLKINVIPNLPTKNIINDNYNNTKEKGILKIIYISRISEKKNLLFALKVLNELEENIIFNIYGPISNEKYWNKCKNIINKMNSNIKVQYKGSIPHHKVNKALRKNDLFLFPTFGENYGHAIVEAMSNGVPVMISDKTPWSDLESQNAGWDISLDNKEKFINTIQKLIFMDKKKYSKYIQGVHNYVNKVFSPDEIAEKYLDLFKKIYG